MSRTFQRLVAWGGLVALATLACTAEDAGVPHIASMTPMTAPQEAHLTVYGAGFGDYDPARSAVFVEGLCADIGAWSPDRVDIIVPSGVGVGTRVLVLVRADGGRDDTAVEVGGVDRPVRRRACEALLRPSLADAVADDDAADTRELYDAVEPDVPPGPPAWSYVRIDDLSLNTIGRNPGADIDAVLLHKADGSTWAARSVLAYSPMPLTPELDDPEAALSWPDCFTYFPDLTWCDIYSGTVSLGGEGMLALRLEAPVAAGDRLEIYERGGCYYAPDLTSLSEAFMVSVGRGDAHATLDTIEWVAVGEGEGPVAEVPIVTLP